MARLFLALWPNDKTREQLFDVAKQFKDENIKLVKKTNLHLTLEFLGEVPDKDKEELKERLNDVKAEPFEIELTRTGFWVRISWLRKAARASRQRLLRSSMA